MMEEIDIADGDYSKLEGNIIYWIIYIHFILFVSSFLTSFVTNYYNLYMHKTFHFQDAVMKMVTFILLTVKKTWF